MNTHDLPRHVAIHNEIRARIASIYGLEEDEQVIVDTASGESDIEETIAQVLREANATKAMSAGLAELIKTMEGRKARLDNKVERLRDAAVWALEEAGLPKITAPDLTASLRPGKPRMVIQEGVLAAQFIKQVMTPKVDREAIQEAIEAGTIPEGVSFTNATPVLTVRHR